MLRPALFLTLLSTFALAANPEGIPADYTLAYSQDFLSPDSVKDFVFTDAAAWKVSDGDSKTALELVTQSKYTPAVRSPVNIALVRGKTFGDFIMEAQCLQTGKEYGHRDMCFFYGFQSPTKFYYTHIATAPDPHAHNCFLVNDAPRVAIGKEVSAGAKWGLGVWHKVRLERKASEGSIRVWFDDMSKPIMTAQDTTHGAGFVGFGSFDDTGKVANIRIWSKDAAAKDTPEFPKP